MKVWQGENHDATITQHTPGGWFYIDVAGRAHGTAKNATAAKVTAEDIVGHKIVWLTA